jgi:hypothetical protein
MSPETFFVYYKSLQIPPVQTVKSFYDVITAESNNPNSLVSQINTKKTQLESECLQEFTKYKLALDPKTKLKPKTSDEIEKEWSNFYSATQNELSEFIKTTFSAWKGKLSTKYKFGSRTLFNDILPSWFEGKIIGITLKNFNLSLFLNPPNPSKLPGINLLFKPTKQIESDKEFEEEFKKQNVNLLEVKNIIDLFLDSYVDAYYQSLGKIKTITALFQNESDGSMLAYFNGSKVVVNLQAFPGIYQIFDFIQNLLAKNFSALKNDSIFQRWFGPNMVLGRAPTVNHELEHARRNDASDKSIHDPAKDALGQDAKFEQCAASFAKKAYDSGLLEKWYALIKMKTLINAKTPKDLEVLSGKVKALEIKNKSELCKRLG